MRTVLLITLTVVASANLDGRASTGRLQGERNMDSFRGKTLRWTFTDGPMAGTLVQHTFHELGVLAFLESLRGWR
jgi:hypothetical protein